MRPQQGESLGGASQANTHPAYLSDSISVSAESQDPGWQDVPQQPWRLTGGSAEAHVGVGPWRCKCFALVVSDKNERDTDFVVEMIKLDQKI